MDTPTLLSEIASAQKRHKMTDSAFGLGAVNDPHFVQSLRKGRRCWPETVKRVLDYISKLNSVQTVRTEDGTVIAYDPVTGTSAVGRTLDEALAELRRLLAAREADARRAPPAREGAAA